MTGTVALRSIDGMHEVSVLFDSRADAEALFDTLEEIVAPREDIAAIAQASSEAEKRIK